MGFGQNVNTGMGNIGTIDTWKAGATIPLGNSYVIANSFPGLWETTSTSINTPKWISVSTGGKGSGQTDFIYEKTFTVPAGIMQLKSNFKIAADDVLKKVELIQPNSTKINVAFTNTGNYKFTKLITDSLACPVKGEWTLRVTVFCGDAKGTQGWTGLLVSGNINLKEGKCPPPPCSCPKGWLANTTNEDGGVSADGKCKKLVCAPITVLPPPNGTSIGNWGFTWGNEIWALGTKENGGAAINCDGKDVNNYEGKKVIANIKNDKPELNGGKESLITILQGVFDNENQKIKVRDIKIIKSTFDYFLSIITTSETKKEVTFFVKLVSTDGVQYKPIGGNSQTPTCVNVINCSPDASNNNKGCSIFQYGLEGYQTGCNCGGDATLANTPANGNTSQKGCNFENGYIRAYDFVTAIDRSLILANWHVE